MSVPPLPFDPSQVQVWYWIAGVVTALLAGLAAPFTLRKLAAEQRAAFVEAMHTANTDLREDVKWLREENGELRQRLHDLIREVEALRPLRGEIARLTAEVERLERTLTAQTHLLEGLARDNPHLAPAIRTVVPLRRPPTPLHHHQDEGDE